MKEHLIVPTPKSRIVALSKLAIWPLVAYGLLQASRHHLSHVAILQHCAQLPWLRIYVLVATMVLTGLSVLVARNGWRIWRSGQYPAPGTSVLFATRIRTGWWARLDTIIMFALSAFSVALLIALLEYFVFSEVGLYVLGLRGCEA